VPLNAVPSGRTSTSSRDESPSASNRLARRTTLVWSVAPPTATGVTWSAANCAIVSGAAGGRGRVRASVNAPAAPAPALVASIT